MNRIGQPYSDGVAMRFRRQSPHINAAHKRCHIKRILQQSTVMMRMPTDDVRIHSGSTDIFSDLIDHQQICIVKRQLGQQRYGLGKELGFACLDVLGPHGLNTGGVVVLVLHQTDPKQDRGLAQHHPAKHPECLLIPTVHCRAMKISSAIMFPHAHHHHLDQAAAQRAAEIIGVRFHAVQHHNAIGLERNRAGECPNAIGRAPHFARSHGRLNGYTHRFLGDPIIGKNPFLSLRRGAAVAAHRRQDKRLHAGRC